MSELAPRAASLDLLRHQDFADVPDISGYSPGTSEAFQLLEDLKEAHYAHLAWTISDLLGEIESHKLARSRNNGLARSPIASACPPWLALRADFLETFRLGAREIRTAPSFKKTREYTKAIETLDPRRFGDLELQLVAGSVTAVNTMHVTLRSLPKLLATHAPEVQPEEYAEIARRSVGIPWRLALTCTTRMMAARDVLTGSSGPERTWSYAASLDPNQFAAKRFSDGGARLVYRDFDNMEIPTGWTLTSDELALLAPTRLGEIACSQPKIVGCPFTLLNGKMDDLWNWYIDLVEARGLWPGAHR